MRRLRLSAFTGKFGGEPLADDIAKILARPANRRTEKQTKALAAYHAAQDKPLAALMARGVKDPQRFARVYAPGFDELEQ